MAGYDLAMEKRASKADKLKQLKKTATKSVSSTKKTSMSKTPKSKSIPKPSAKGFASTPTKGPIPSARPTSTYSIAPDVEGFKPSPGGPSTRKNLGGIVFKGTIGPSKKKSSRSEMRPKYSLPKF